MVCQNEGSLTNSPHPSFTFLHPRYLLKREHLSRSTSSLWGLGPQALTEARPVSALSSPSRNLASDPGAGQTAAPARVGASPRLTTSRTGHGLALPGVKRPRSPGTVSQAQPQQRPCRPCRPVPRQLWATVPRPVTASGKRSLSESTAPFSSHG